MGRPDRDIEAPKVKTLEAPVDYAQMAHYFKGADIKDFRTPYDTGSTYCPQLDIYSGAQPVDGFKTDKGRAFQFDKNGDANYRVTNKDYRGLNDIVTDYMTTRDGRKPTPQQVQQMVDKMVKDPTNRITDVNNIRVGQNLRFPGPETAPRVNRQSDLPPTDYRYPERPGFPQPGYDRPIGLRPPEKQPSSPYVQPPGTEQGDDKSRIKNVTERKTDESGNTTTKYNGELKNGELGAWMTGWMVGRNGRTQFEAQDKTDQQGRLLERTVKYSSGVEVKMPNPKGGETTVEVKQMDIKYNPRTGNYDTTMTGSDGQKYHMQTDRNGKLLK